MRRALGSAASRSPSPQPTSSTDASAGTMRLNASFMSSYRKSRAPACAGMSRARVKKSCQAASSASDREGAVGGAPTFAFDACFGFVFTGPPVGGFYQSSVANVYRCLKFCPGRTLMLSVWSICMSERLNASLCLPQGSL